MGPQCRSSHLGKAVGSLAAGVDDVEKRKESRSVK